MLVTCPFNRISTILLSDSETITRKTPSSPPTATSKLLNLWKSSNNHLQLTVLVLSPQAKLFWKRGFLHTILSVKCVSIIWRLKQNSESLLMEIYSTIAVSAQLILLAMAFKLKESLSLDLQSGLKKPARLTLDADKNWLLFFHPWGSWKEAIHKRWNSQKGLKKAMWLKRRRLLISTLLWLNICNFLEMSTCVILMKRKNITHRFVRLRPLKWLKLWNKS